MLGTIDATYHRVEVTPGTPACSSARISGGPSSSGSGEGGGDEDAEEQSHPALSVRVGISFRFSAEVRRVDAVLRRLSTTQRGDQKGLLFSTKDG